MYSIISIEKDDEILLYIIYIYIYIITNGSNCIQVKG